MVVSRSVLVYTVADSPECGFTSYGNHPSHPSYIVSEQERIHLNPTEKTHKKHLNSVKSSYVPTGSSIA
jgi:hypothetical protein